MWNTRFSKTANGSSADNISSREFVRRLLVNSVQQHHAARSERHKAFGGATKQLTISFELLVEQLPMLNAGHLTGVQCAITISEEAAGNRNVLSGIE